MNAYEELTPFPGAVDVLADLSDADYTVAVLSNGNPAMLETLADTAGLAEQLDDVVSADAVETFKPAPIGHENAADELGESIGKRWLVTGNAWDAAGAGAAGTDRLGQPASGSDRAHRPRPRRGRLGALGRRSGASRA